MQEAASKNRNSLQRGLQRLERSGEVLRELGSIWHGPKERNLWWDSYNGVLATRTAERTYRCIFGNGFTRFSRNAASFLHSKLKRIDATRWTGPLDVDIEWPADAIVIPRKVTIVASAATGKVLKLLPRTHRDQWSSEVSALSMAHGAGLGAHLPNFEAGSATGGRTWLLMDMVPNDTPFADRLERVTLPIWQRWLREHVLPYMGRFYGVAGIEQKPFEEVLGEVDGVLESVDAPESLLAVRQLIAGAVADREMPPFVISTVHGDLTSRHVHRSDGRWWLIDWGNSRRDVILWDLFKVHIARPLSPTPRVKAFWQWLRGDVDIARAHRSLKSDVRIYTHFQTSNIGCPISSDQLRAQLLLFIYDRCAKAIAPFAQNDLVAEPGDEVERRSREPFNDAMRQLRMLGVA